MSIGQLNSVLTFHGPFHVSFFDYSVAGSTAPVRSRVRVYIVRFSGNKHMHSAVQRSGETKSRTTSACGVETGRGGGCLCSRSVRSLIRVLRHRGCYVLLVVRSVSVPSAMFCSYMRSVRVGVGDIVTKVIPIQRMVNNKPTRERQHGNTNTFKTQRVRKRAESWFVRSRDITILLRSRKSANINANYDGAYYGKSTVFSCVCVFCCVSYKKQIRSLVFAYFG